MTLIMPIHVESASFCGVYPRDYRNVLQSRCVYLWPGLRRVCFAGWVGVYNSLLLEMYASYVALFPVVRTDQSAIDLSLGRADLFFQTTTSWLCITKAAAHAL